MDTLLLIVIGVFGLIVFGWALWVLAQILFGLILINFAGPMLFWESKNPIKWVGLAIWLLGIWLAWEYNTNTTEYVCPEGMSNCSWSQQIPAPISWSDLAFNMFLAIALITVVAGITVAVLIDKTEDYFKQQQAKDRRDMEAYNLGDQDYVEHSAHLTTDIKNGNLVSSIYEQQVIESLSVSEAADKYDVSETTIRKWLSEGELDGYKNGNRWVISVFSDKTLTVKEASERFGVSAAKIRKWLNEGEIGGHKNDRGQWRIYAPD